MATPAERPRKVYRGEALRALAMPLGGLGTGSIALCGDGSLRQWQISNHVNHLACVPHSFLAVWCQPPSGPGVARVLQSEAFYTAPGLAPPPTSNDHVVPAAQRALLRALPGVSAIAFTGEYPIAELAYADAQLPLSVSLEAFSPFIPLEPMDSGLPAILFNLTLTNPNNFPMQAAAAFALQNLVGWDGLVPISGGRCPLYGGNTNQLVRQAEFTALSMANAHLRPHDANYGSLVLAVASPEATALTHWLDLRELWDDFSTDGRLNGNGEQAGPSAAGETWNGAVAVAVALPPGAAATVAFTLAWHFPNRMFDYASEHVATLLGFGQEHPGRSWIGNHYARWFNSALDVAQYVHQHRPRLEAQTRLARDTLYNTTLPLDLIDAVASQISVLRSPTCFWAHDGNFYGYEGCGGASTPKTGAQGCCPLNCTHVWNYEMALARLFPSLERSMRAIEWKVQQAAAGFLPHRVRLPLDLPRPGERGLAGPDRAALDGLLGAILKTYREYRACGDVAWLGGMWPGVKRALQHVWRVHDLARAGVIVGEQPTTYDVSIYGLNPLIGTLYLAALRACEAMARAMGLSERALADACRATYERGRAALEQRLWNGEYYRQALEPGQPVEQSWGPGCHADQLLGQWWAYQLGLGDLLDPEHTRQAAQAMIRHNFREHFRGHRQSPRAFVTEDDQGVLICTWPKGGRPAVPTQYSDEVWTGIEYEVAALLLFEGDGTAAQRLVGAVRARHDGRKQNPWNDTECGDHYVRALSAWSLLEAAAGFDYDAGAAMIGFAPRLTPEDFRAPFVARDGWGTYSQQMTDNGLTACLQLVYGTLLLHGLRLRAPDGAGAVSVTCEGQGLGASLDLSTAQAVIRLDEEVRLDVGCRLQITLS